MTSAQNQFAMNETIPRKNIWLHFNLKLALGSQVSDLLLVMQPSAMNRPKHLIYGGI